MEEILKNIDPNLILYETDIKNFIDKDTFEIIKIN